MPRKAPLIDTSERAALVEEAALELRVVQIAAWQPRNRLLVLDNSIFFGELKIVVRRQRHVRRVVVVGDTNVRLLRSRPLRVQLEGDVRAEERRGYRAQPEVCQHRHERVVVRRVDGQPRLVFAGEPTPKATADLSRQCARRQPTHLALLLVAQTLIAEAHAVVGEPANDILLMVLEDGAALVGEQGHPVSALDHQLLLHRLHVLEGCRERRAWVELLEARHAPQLVHKSSHLGPRRLLAEIGRRGEGAL
mmetsp:Transcript_48103/g.102773  ORF Transcript_48103/g.102773 Transcript_48103/m.102773 type:complete len:250 (-) Transcript_48103:255-1004(-)